MVDSITNTDFINDFWNINDNSFIKDNYENINIIKRYCINEYTFAINYTFYLKIFQKRYRRWLKRRRKISSLDSLLKRQLYGKFV